MVWVKFERSQLPAVATSIAAATEPAGQGCCGTGGGVSGSVTVVRSSSVPLAPSTRTLTVGPASAVDAAVASATTARPAARPGLDPSFMLRATPFPRGLRTAFGSEGGLLASGPTSPRLPGSHVAGQWPRPPPWRPPAVGFPGHSGGTAPDLHRLPCPP